MADETRRLFQDRFGPTTIRIPEFVQGPAAHVEIINLEVVLPEYFGIKLASADLDLDGDRSAL
jgi:hypothetical protein